MNLYNYLYGIAWVQVSFTLQVGGQVKVVCVCVEDIPIYAVHIFIYLGGGEEAEFAL